VEYACRDKFGLVHRAFVSKNGKAWHYNPWCDLRGNVWFLWETKHVKKGTPLTCLPCIHGVAGS
jgi:hypothetical protein